MSLPYGQQQPELFRPPPTLVPTQQTHAYHGERSSAGPIIAVLAVVLLLSIISAMVGRLCAGRRIPGLGQCDFEGWFERKFAACIDGSIGQPPRVSHVNGTTGVDGSSAVPILIPVGMSQEVKQSTVHPSESNAGTEA